MSVCGGWGGIVRGGINDLCESSGFVGYTRPRRVAGERERERERERDLLAPLWFLFYDPHAHRKVWIYT